MDTISYGVMHKIASSFAQEVPEDAIVHTVNIELNGRHGGVDVAIEWSREDGPDDGRKTWEVH